MSRLTRCRENVVECRENVAEMSRDVNGCHLTVSTQCHTYDLDQHVDMLTQFSRYCSPAWAAGRGSLLYGWLEEWV